MTDFERATIDTVGNLVSDLKLHIAQSDAFQRSLLRAIETLGNELRAAIAHRDSALEADLASTNDRLSKVERAQLKIVRPGGAA